MSGRWEGGFVLFTAHVIGMGEWQQRDTAEQKKGLKAKGHWICAGVCVNATVCVNELLAR